MIKVAEIVQVQVEASPFLTEAIQEGLINISALARKLQPQVEKELGKSVRESAIVMAIKRMHFGAMVAPERAFKQFFAKLSDISVRSNLVDYTFRNSSHLLDGLTDLIQLIRSKYPTAFYSVSQGISETTIVVPNIIEEDIDQLFRKQALIDKEVDLSAITLKLPKENREIYGIYYYILKELAWKGINLIELISTSNEFTLIVSNEDLNLAFSVVSDLRKRSNN